MVAAADAGAACGALERFAFHDRVQGAFAVVTTPGHLHGFVKSLALGDASRQGGHGDGAAAFFGGRNPHLAFNLQ